MAQEIAFGYEDSPRYWAGDVKTQLVLCRHSECLDKLFPDWFGILEEFNDKCWNMFNEIEPQIAKTFRIGKKQ
jgi:hypothetical protein